MNRVSVSLTEYLLPETATCISLSQPFLLARFPFLLAAGTRQRHPFTLIGRRQP